MKKFFLALCAFCLCHQTILASELENTKDTSPGNTVNNEEAQHIDEMPVENRKKSFSANINISPLNLPFPLAWGLNASYAISDKWTVKADYQTSSLGLGWFVANVGELSEKNYTIEFRRYIGSSFNFNMGIGQRYTTATLQAKLFVASVSDELAKSKLKTNYLRLGFGNRWKISGRYIISVDWLNINIPYSGSVEESAAEFASSDSSKSDIETAEKFLKFYPSAGVLQFNIGVAF